MEKRENLIWLEKYRPKTFDEFVGQDEIIQAIKPRIGNLPNLIFEGKAGTGKTSLAKLLAKEIDAELLELNASDERGIDVIRGKVLSFVKHLSFTNAPYKLAFLDEADSITVDAQSALRAIIEKYNHNVRFIFGCNYIDKIIQPIRSRCKVYRFKPIAKEAVLKRLLYIAERENIFVSMSDKDRALGELSERCRGDMRKAINSLQMGDYDLSETEQIFSL